MAKFITGKELEDEICKIIWEAKQTLIIVSPFIKLDSFFTKHFENHINNFELHLILVFGKNEADKSKSLNRNDFEFFKNFTNVSIIYEPKLHAKYYGNETKGVLTSINLYDASFKNNIEFGVLSEVNLLNKFIQTTDQDAWEKCLNIANNGEPVFIKRPAFKKNIFSSLLGKNYVTSQVLLDNTEPFYNTYGKTKSGTIRLTDFPEEVDVEQKQNNRPTREEFANKESINVSSHNSYPNSQNHFGSSSINNQQRVGYCIRTGNQIPFNIDDPLSPPAFRSWNQYGNRDYPENFCHFSGEPSNGQTSVNKPILKKYWKIAQELHGFH